MGLDFGNKVPTFAEYIAEGAGLSVEYDKESYDSKYKSCEAKLTDLGKQMQKSIDDFKAGKVTLDQLKDVVGKYVIAQADLKYLSIMNGANSMSNQPQTPAQQEATEQNQNAGQTQQQQPQNQGATQGNIKPGNP